MYYVAAALLVTVGTVLLRGPSRARPVRLERVQLWQHRSATIRWSSSPAPRCAAAWGMFVSIK